jgi:hypothetical protein
MYVPVPTSEIARSVELIADAVKPLSGNDSMKYLSSSALPVEFNRSFDVVPESLTNLLVNESLVNDAQMILMVKKPDFLGDSKWEFRYGTTSLQAKMQDLEWLANSEAPESRYCLETRFVPWSGQQPDMDMTATWWIFNMKSRRY